MDQQIKVISIRVVLVLAAFSVGIFLYSNFSYAPKYISEELQDFTLSDQNGKSWSFADFSRQKAVVIISFNVNCHITNNSLKVIAALREKYEHQGIQFIGIDPNFQDSESVGADDKPAFPILVDRTQQVSRGFGLTRAAEVLLIEVESRRILYRGAVADFLPRQAEGKMPYLESAISSFLHRRPLESQETSSLGCAITYFDQK